MPCRNCPTFIDRAITALEDIQRNRPDLLPPEHDYENVLHVLKKTRDSVIQELIRQGRWRGPVTFDETARQ